MLGVASSFAPDVADKRIGFPQALSSKGLKFFPGQRSDSVAFGPGLMLLPAMEDAVFQERRCKRYAFVALGLGGLKVILALLTKMIAFHVRVAIIEIRVPGLQRPIRDILSGFC